MDEMTQQNAALVEESAAAAESLQNQATQLAHLVDTFKLVREVSGTSHAVKPAQGGRAGMPVPRLAA